MDSLIAAAARALAQGDVLGALKRVALRDDPPALALRGIAMAQVGDHPRARELLRGAARGFGANEKLARARCVVAEAEVALAMRDLTWSPGALESAIQTLNAHQDKINALHAQLIAIRRLLLIGKLEQAERALTNVDTHDMPPSLVAIAELTTADLSLRSVRIRAARLALDRAYEAARRAKILPLLAEVEQARATIEQPVAKQVRSGSERTLRFEEIETLLTSGDLIIDAGRRTLRSDVHLISLARRPVLFALARALGEAWPHDVDRTTLIERAFGTNRPNPSYRSRLRVEMGRLRKTLLPIGRVEATPRGFVLQAHSTKAVSVLLPLIDDPRALLVALLSDGEGWSTSALALAMATSQRTVQRALVELEAAGRVHSVGRTRSRRWLSAPLSGFATTLLLPATLSPG